MTATAAIDDPLPPFYIGANLASTPEDDEATLFPGPLRCFDEKSPFHRHGTHHAVAKRVAKFPFRLPDNSRHEPHPPTATTIAPVPPPDPTTPPTKYLTTASPKCALFDLEALRQQVQNNTAAMDRWMEEMKAWQTTPTTMPTSLPQPSPRSKTMDLPLTTPTPMNPEPAKDPVDTCTLQASDRSFVSPQMPVLPTLPPYPCPAPHQPAPLLTPQTSLSRLPHTAITSQPCDSPARTNPTLQQHHRTMTPTTATIHIPTPLTMVIDTSSITEPFQRHHTTLDHFEATIQQLSHSMDRLETTIDQINQILQPTTQTRPAVPNHTSHPTLSIRIPSPATATPTPQTLAPTSCSSIWTPRIPPKPPNPITLNNHCPYDPSDTQLMISPPPAIIKGPQSTTCHLFAISALEKSTRACMSHKPHPSTSFVNLLCRFHANNYRPP